ncbi:AAA-domain-containing protein [Trichoderma citrinoviride]|uniref:AAA-domain-containing protein n=1 Tax=Trichoderma citrinoviride TaxID=58853 RepID=A0A2T4B4R1_9HYPO|nr:AAA-domain-containing protein [Trichoderma citrinoviride]PTB64290.1 AAA-domain-containing protein [Trichoderma citrinoviride]
MVSNKRKRHEEVFDPNVSDPEDENFDPREARPTRGSKKTRQSKGAKGGSKRTNRYRGSDIDDDDDELSDEESFAEATEESDDEAPLTAAGRPARKAATKPQIYKESSEDDDEDDLDEEQVDWKAKEEEQEKPDEIADVPPKPTRRDATKVVKLKVSKTALAQTRSTRSRTEDAPVFVELSASGRHAVAPRGESRSKSPEALARSGRPSRAAKGLKKAPEPIQEAAHEGSNRDADEPDELSQDTPTNEITEVLDSDMPDAAKDADEEEAGEEAPAENPVAAEQDDDDEDDDVEPTARRLRSRANAAASTDDAVETTEGAEAEEADDGGKRRSRRLKRGSRKPANEQSSDFEPDDDADDDAEASDPGRNGNKNDAIDSPTPRGRQTRSRGRSGRSSRRRNSSADDLPVDIDELEEEARELRKSSRNHRKTRTESPIQYQESSRRPRPRINYYMPPLGAVNIEEEAEDPAPTPARNRRRGGASAGWDRNLNTTYGPFGGGGAVGSLLGGPWGTGATGGVDSDSSDDEMVHRSTAAGNVGMTPTSAAPAGGLVFGGGQGHGGVDGVGATPNVGKIKDRKALADADPLGVDLNVDFSKVGGLQGHIDQLKEMVQLPLLYPELFTRFHVTPPRGVLFHGPPGTGKTLLARALANSVGSGGKKISFYMRKGADALSKWVGEAEKQLRLLFEEARKNQPSIIFFDEIDGLAPVRSSKQEQIHASIVSTLLALMDGMDGRGQVIVIGATNRPDNIDPALRRPGRFDREFYFPLPDLEGRRSILNIHTQDWGLSDEFLQSLAENTKGYGGADLRALCTEASLNAIQRTYPQIYSSKEKLLVDPAKISVHASDFMISIKKMIPSSERSATSGARPLPASIAPLLRDQFEEAKQALDLILPRKKKTTALEEAMYEQYEDKDHGFGRETLNQEFERSRVFRPRFLISGAHGMGQGYLSSAILHHFEGIHVQNFDLPSLLNDGRPMEQVIVALFTEVRRHKPSVIFIPNIDAWYAVLNNTLALVTFRTMLKSIPPTDPVLLFATADCEKKDLPQELVRDFFGYSSKNLMEIQKPERINRIQYFGKTLDYARLAPHQFPDLENRKKRVLEELPVAPPPPVKPPTKEEVKALKKRDHQLLNALKIQLQPIMDQINRRYKKFRQPVIPQSQIEYLFMEADPNYVRPDLEEGENRPFEIVKDKYGNDVLMHKETGKYYYNLETTTIEERLSNGFYARPKDFLFDIKALARDAKNIGDKERTLKANELLSNVEVDVASIESSTAHIDWEALYQRQQQRAKEAAEKERKRKAMQSVLDRVQSDLGGGNDSDSQGPLTLGEPVPGARTMARFQIRSPLSNGHGESGHDEHSLSNGVPDLSKEGDVQMSGTDDSTQVALSQTQSSPMGPPPRSSEGSSSRNLAAMGTQVSQRSAVTTLPAGVSPSAVINEASTTKTSDLSTYRSNNWSSERRSSQNTNGNHEHEEQLPDTLVVGQSQARLSLSDDSWIHSQAPGRAVDDLNSSGSLLDRSSFQSQPNQGSAAVKSLVSSSPQESNAEARSKSTRGSGSSQPLEIDKELEKALMLVTDLTAGCTIEQLEQVNREMMDEIWRGRHEWNRVKVVLDVSGVFNRTIEEIVGLQGVVPLSQLQDRDD